MKLVSRTTLIVKAKEPYLEWANSIDDFKVTLEELHVEPTAFLVSQHETDHEKDKILKKHFKEIFEYELAAWFVDEEVWPKNRDFKMFKEWFDVSFHSMTLDLLPQEIEREEFDIGL